MDSFKALLIEEIDSQVGSTITQMTEDRLDAGEVTIRVAYSSVNYKDALAATGSVAGLGAVQEFGHAGDGSRRSAP